MASRSERTLGALAFTATLAPGAAAQAEPAPVPPVPPVEEPPAVEEPRRTFMHGLAARGLHDVTNERWNVYGQLSLIGHGKAPFSAPYTNLNGSTKSLLPTAEGSWTGTFTAYLGARLWPGAEAYVVPEIISERPLSNLSGLGGAIQNAELQKGGLPAPTLYMSRVFLRQTFGFGGGRVVKESGPMQLGTTVDARRLVLSLGKFSTIDFLDKNSFAGDIRRQFLSLAHMTHASWDFATDARGYTWGLAVELYLGDWALRFAHTTVPVDPNMLEIDFRFWKYFGDQLELEHVHTIAGQRGAVWLLGYRNYQNMGRFDDAVAAFEADPSKNAAACTSFHYSSTNATAPDLCWVRKPNAKVGIGINLEQAIGDDIGLFFRGMYSDGQTEVYAYMPADRSISFGGIARGTHWRRPGDTLGVAGGVSWISGAHAAYLGKGGIDGFIGDGRINAAAETTFEVFYSLRVLQPLWVTVDFQHVEHPAYNADRGPVNLFGGRLHAEF